MEIRNWWKVALIPVQLWASAEFPRSSLLTHPSCCTWNACSYNRVVFVRQAPLALVVPTIAVTVFSGFYKVPCKVSKKKPKFLVIYTLVLDEEINMHVPGF